MAADDASLVHLSFVVGQLKEALQDGQTYPTSCPQCKSGSISFSVGGFQFGRNYNLDAGVEGGMKTDMRRFWMGRESRGSVPMRGQTVGRVWCKRGRSVNGKW